MLKFLSTAIAGSVLATGAFAVPLTLGAGYDVDFLPHPNALASVEYNALTGGVGDGNDKIYVFTDQGSNLGYGAPGGLHLGAGTYDITMTYLGSHAGRTNSYEFDFGLGSIGFDQTSAVGASETLEYYSTGEFLDFTFNSVQGGWIDNRGGAESFGPGLVNLAFSEFFYENGQLNILAFFGDGAGDEDHNDFAVRFTVTPVPVPAAGLLLVAGLAGLGGVSRMRRKSA